MKPPRATPQFAFYERLVMRLLFAWMVWESTPGALVVNGIPSPNGIARLIDLRFLLDPHLFAIARIVLAGALILYALRLLSWLALPIALLTHVAANAIRNSQGAIQHAIQIVSLVLLAQTVAYFYGLWRRRHGPEEDRLLEDRAMWWSQQTIVAVYLVAGITKLLVTKGLWVLQAQWIGVSVAKSAYQTFYDRFDQAGLQHALSVAQFAASHGWVVAITAAAGLFLELGSPIMLCNRASAAIFGALLIGFHVGLDYSMGLTFVYNQWLLLIFMINAPYWLVTAFGKLWPRSAAYMPMI